MRAAIRSKVVMNPAIAGLFLFGLILFLLASGALAKSSPDEGPDVETRIILDHPVVQAGKPAEVFVLIEFNVGQVHHGPDYRRPPLNISLVIDRSGSMSAQGKLEYAKKAAKMLVDRLGPEDRLGVVQYDDRISVLWPAGPLRSPDMVKMRIDKLVPGGSTNLTGGMMRGVDQVLKGRELEQINRVILLSDGLANQGITNPGQIAALVRQARGQGVRISTMGLGLEYNEDLMQNIAESGGGNYYYIESPTQMARIFQRELQILFSTVAKEPCLVFHPSAHIKHVEVFGYNAQKMENGYKILMENFYAGEKRSLLLKLSLDPVQAGEFSLGDLRMEYLSADSQERQGDLRSLQVEASRDEQEVKAATNQKAKVEATLAMAEKRQEELVKEFQKGNRAAAQQGLSDLAATLAATNKNLDDPKLQSKLEAVQMEAQQQVAAQSAPAMARYVKASKQRIYQAKRGKQAYMLKPGDKGLMVERLQKALQDAGLYKGPLDGNYTPEVDQAVRKYQAQHNMDQDGVAGPRTLNQLGLY